MTGKILEILQDEGGTMSFVVIDIFQVSAIRHEYFGMPILSRRLDEITLLVVPAKVGTLCIDDHSSPYLRPYLDDYVSVQRPARLPAGQVCRFWETSRCPGA